MQIAIPFDKIQWTHSLTKSTTKQVTGKRIEDGEKFLQLIHFSIKLTSIKL